MNDEVEFLIEQILARKEEADAGPPLRDPNCPDEILLMAVALEQAPAGKQREVEDHAAHCGECRWRLRDYRKYYRGEEVPEPPVKGSLLETAADRRPFVRKQPPAPPTTDMPISGPPVIPGFTLLARAGKVKEIGEGLRPWLPTLLAWAGLGSELCDDVLAYVLERTPSLPPGAHFGEVLPRWIQEFAAMRGLADRTRALPALNDRAVVARLSVQAAVRESSEEESPLARVFRAYVLEQQFASPEELLTATVPEPLSREPALASYRRGVFLEARRFEEIGEVVFLN